MFRCTVEQSGKEYEKCDPIRVFRVDVSFKTRCHEKAAIEERGDRIARTESDGGFERR